MKIWRANIHQFCQRYQGTNSPDVQGRGHMGHKLVSPVYGWSKEEPLSGMVGVYLVLPFIPIQNAYILPFIHVQYLSQELSILSFVYPPYVFFFSTADYFWTNSRHVPAQASSDLFFREMAWMFFRVLLGWFLSWLCWLDPLQPSLLII